MYGYAEIMLADYVAGAGLTLKLLLCLWSVFPPWAAHPELELTPAGANWGRPHRAPGLQLWGGTTTGASHITLISACLQVHLPPNLPFILPGAMCSSQKLKSHTPPCPTPVPTTHQAQLILPFGLPHVHSVLITLSPFPLPCLCLHGSSLT